MKERKTGRRTSARLKPANAIKNRRWLAAWSIHAWPLSVILLFFVFCFGGFLIRGQFLIGGDVFFYLHPLRTVAFDLIRSGQVPVWTPLILSGYPLLAMSQVAVAYPINWTHLFLPSHWALQIFVLVPFLLAPAFTYAYVRTLGLTRTAALLAGLSFTYGGLMTNTYGMNGLPGNALMWLPLLLVVIERSVSRSFIPHLLAATAIYSLSILTGHGQSFLQFGILALVYGAFLVIKSSGDFFRRERWRPFLLVLFAIVLAGGLTAFQIFESMRAARLSIRSTLSAAELGAGGFTLAEAIRSFAAPLFHYLEVTTYQAPLVLVLAISAIVMFRRLPDKRDPRILFWSLVTATAFVLLLGANTPAYRLIVHVPFLNMVRRPSRYVFEFTFALSILAAYGWDAINRYADSWFSKTKQKENAFTFSDVGFVPSIVLAFGWERAIRYGGSETTYLMWKSAFTLTACAAIFWCFLKPSRNTKLLAFALIFVCFVEPFILIGQWWPGTAKPASRFSTPSLTTSWLQQFSPLEQRVYVRANGPEEESATPPRIDALDRTALFGLHNVGGYEGFIFERYSRALGNVEFDAVGPRAGFSATNALFDAESHVFDLLNTGYVVTWPNLSALPEPASIERAGARFADRDLGVDIAPGTTTKLPAASNTGDTLFLVTSLAHSTSLKDGTEVARIRVLTVDGRMTETAIRAGFETAEWAHERPDIRPSIQHRVAPVFDRTKGDETGSFTALRYLARVPLGQRAAISQIEIQNENSVAPIAVWKVTIFDTDGARSHPLSKNQTTADPTRWQLVKELDGVQILRNLRSLPRVWLAQQAEAVDGAEALRRISRDPGFDPRRTALLEVNRDELPRLASTTTNPNSMTARLVGYEPTHLTITTNAEVPTVLVVSESFYPGWEATLDGQHVPVMIADYLLRAVYVPAGQHQIEMSYHATAARKGAIISILTLTVVIGLFVYSRRTTHAHSDQQQ